MAFENSVKAKKQIAHEAADPRNMVELNSFTTTAESSTVKSRRFLISSVCLWKIIEGSSIAINKFKFGTYSLVEVPYQFFCMLEASYSTMWHLLCRHSFLSSSIGG